jgi:hypothetical protein
VKFIFLLIISLTLLVGGLSAASSIQAKESHPTDGVFSGGIGVSWPEIVSYRYIGNDSAFLWLPNQGRLKVQSLVITPLAPGEIGCVGILGLP